MPIDIEAMRAEFERKGFLIVPEALTSEQVDRINAALDADREANGPWPLGRGDEHSQDARILDRVEELDVAAANPLLLPLITALVGEHATLDEFSVMFRSPTKVTEEETSWHRDFPRDETYPFGLHALSLIYYLTDVTAADHCFALATGSHNTIEVAPEATDPATRLDVVAAAGTAVFFHTALAHTAKIKPGSRQRRTIHIYYGHADAPQVSACTEIPERLRATVDPALPPELYSRRPKSEVTMDVK